MIKINTNYRVTIKIERVLIDGTPVGSYTLSKLIDSIPRLKETINALVNSSQKYVREDIEKKKDPQTLGSIMSS